MADENRYPRRIALIGQPIIEINPTPVFNNHHRVKKLLEIKAVRDIVTDEDELNTSEQTLIEMFPSTISTLQMIQFLETSDWVTKNPDRAFYELLRHGHVTFLYGAEYQLTHMSEAYEWTSGHYVNLLDAYASKRCFESGYRMIELMMANFSRNIISEEGLDVSDFVTEIIARQSFTNKHQTMSLLEPPKTTAIGYKRSTNDTDHETSSKKARSTSPSKPRKNLPVYGTISHLRGAKGLTEHMVPKFYIEYLKPHRRVTLASLIEQANDMPGDTYSRSEVAMHILLYGHDVGGLVLNYRWAHLIWPNKDSPCTWANNARYELLPVKGYNDRTWMKLKRGKYIDSFDTFEVLETDWLQYIRDMRRKRKVHV